MGTINIVKTIKKIHENCLVLVKIGTFYHAYSKDAYIMSYLFEYKIKEKESVPTCAFPVSSLSKVENILEKAKVNYIVVDKRSNYEEEEKYIDNQENNYEKIFAKAKESVEFMLRIQRVYDTLLHNKDSENIEEKLEKIEMVLKDD